MINISFSWDEEKIKIISDCLVFPSWNEGQPIVILKAMSQGLIVLSTNIGLIPEILGENYPFCSENNNTKNLGLCVKKYINYNFKKKLSLSLKESYNKIFSWLEQNNKLLKVFK